MPNQVGGDLLHTMDVTRLSVHLAFEDYRTGATATPTNESAQP
jgi:hypothetical protein